MVATKLGYARECINPPIGSGLAGYEYERYAEGIHDDLYARIIAIEQEKTLVLVELDLIAADNYFIELLSMELLRKFGIDKESVFVSCIHTHSGPGGIFNQDTPLSRGSKYIFNEYNDGYVHWLIAQICSGVYKCLSNLAEFNMTYKRSALAGVGLNRRHPSIPVDDELQLILFTREDGKKVILYNYACHPTVLSKYNMQISADFPGETACLLESRSDIGLAVFFNGACGDVSTRFTRKESSFKEAERIGDILAGELLKLASQPLELEKVEDIKIGSGCISLKIKPLMTLDEAKAVAESARRDQEKAEAEGVAGSELRLYQSKFEGAVNNLHLVKSLEGIEFLEVRYKIIKMNSRYLVYIPGELFTSLGLMLKRRFADKSIIISCYGNGYVGYIPDVEAYRQGGYETASTPFAEGEGEKLIQNIIATICSM